MASPAPWLHWTQTELTRWEGEEEEEEEGEDDDFERRMDEDGVIGLGEEARSPPWGDGEDLEEGSLAEEGRWHSRQDLVEEEEQSSSGGDEGPWGTESDGEPYPELSYEGQWGSGSGGSPEALRDAQALCQPRGCSTDAGDTSGLSDASPGPTTPSRWHPGWDTARDTSRGCGQGWTSSQSLLQPLSTDEPRDTTSTEPVPKPQMAGTQLPAPGSTSLAPTREPWGSRSPLAPQLHDRSQLPKKASPRVLPPKPDQPARSLSPQRRHRGGKETRDPSGTGSGTADGIPYGRGRLNHPLPDLSKVEARVKFDQSYRPPRGRVLPTCPRAPGRPIGFKSPAEIVREVLLSSGEGLPPQPPTSPGLPQEFRSPRQATVLVQQLQDDYHKLLTKYAEAENTIDQLRLGARVNLYADPPQPSRSLTVGTMGPACQVMTLSIPQARTAAISMAPAPASPGGAPAPGPSDLGGSPQPSSPTPHSRGCPTCLGSCCCSGTKLTQTLAGQTHKLQAQVESFEGWIQTGSPTPREQLQRFRKLKEAQDALEQAYLGARQQHPEASGEFDPDRKVEGEIFHLGLCLEELKERLEPGTRQQLPQQHPAQPRSPPTSSPLPTPCSPHPKSPMLMEGPQGTTGDNEVVTRGLPWPLWHKQLQVEEDFDDLLQQYKHFKSLPESLSLEQLSLAESRSQEEVDGPAAGNGDSSRDPCGTQSLEEGSDLKTSPLHPLERRATPLPPRMTSWSGEMRGHLSPATAEEPPASSKPPQGLPDPPRAPQSRRSSGTGSTATQQRPRKEQRIVSPETDSGFVGSEASRVSPPVHTPEHRHPGTRTPSSLGHSIPIPTSLHPLQKREVTPLPSKTALTDICLTGGQGGTGVSCLPPSTPWQSSSPQPWAESVGSEVGPDGDGTHMDSEAEGRSCVSTGGHPPAMARGPASPPPSPETPSPALLSPDPPSLDPSPCDLLGSRLERDQAIRALRDEVWWLRRRLEESLRRSRSYPEGRATPRVTPARRQPVANRPLSPKDTAPSGEPSPTAWGRVAPGVVPTRRGRSASLPRDRPELDITLSPDPADPIGSHPASLSSAATSESDPSPTGPRAAPSPRKSPSCAMTLRGQYTGTRYQAGMPRATPAPREEPGRSKCPRCHRSQTPSSGFQVGNTRRQPQHSTPKRTRCPTCQAPMGAPIPSSRDDDTHADPGPSGMSPPGSHVGPQAKKLEQPGLWYLAGSPGATTAISCLAPVPLVPCVPSVLYCSPAVPTSAPAMAGVPLQQPVGHPPQPHAAGHHHCLSLDLEELNWSLSRAMEAAQSMRLTSTRMSRTLASELSRARALRGSCLF